MSTTDAEMRTEVAGNVVPGDAIFDADANLWRGVVAIERRGEFVCFWFECDWQGRRVAKGASKRWFPASEEVGHSETGLRGWTSSYAAGLAHQGLRPERLDLEG